MRKTKILLINPPANIVESRSEIKLACPPLGLAYIAAVLENKGYRVEIFDTLINNGYANETQPREGFIRYGLDEREIEARIRSFKPDVVGISGLHSNRIFEVRETTRAAKKVSEDIITIVGGGLASLNTIECLQDPNCDYAVIGEGEHTIVELLETFEKKGDIGRVNGVGYKKNGKVVINPRRKVIWDLDSIPFPAYHLMEMEAYFNIDMPGSRYGKSRYALFCGSRGCPHSCHYCAKPLLVGEGYRARSIRNMLDEIKFLKEKYNIEELRFVDYHAMADINRWKRFCRAIIKENIEIEFNDPHGMAVRSLDDEVLELMRIAGCKKLYISIESADQNYLDLLNKGVDLNKAEKIIKKARELDYFITGYFIIGIPGQTWNSIKNTTEYAKRLDLDDVDFFIANPFPGSALYDECVEKKMLTDNYHPSRLKYGLCNIKSNEFTPEQLESFRKKAWLDFMVNKKRNRLK